MKRIYLSLVAMLVAIAASAQVYVGGQVGLWRNTDDNHSKFSIAPEVGYNLSDKWAIGIGIGYAYNYVDGFKTNAFAVSPYARFTAAKLGPVSFLLDGGFDFSTVKFKTKKMLGQEFDDSYNAWAIGIKPAVKVNLSKNIDFIASLGFLGYRDYDDTGVEGFDYSSVYGEKGFGFSFSGNDLSFGVIYNF